MSAVRKIHPVTSDKIEAIHDKLENGQELTRGEKATEATKEESAYLLSVIAGRKIDPSYLKQLIFHKRLKPHRAIGNTYTYFVADLLNVRFTSPHAPKKEGTNETQQTAK